MNLLIISIAEYASNERESFEEVSAADQEQVQYKIDETTRRKGKIRKIKK
jgi:hypothetical protein